MLGGNLGSLLYGHVFVMTLFRHGITKAIISLHRCAADPHFCVKFSAIIQFHKKLLFYFKNQKIFDIRMTSHWLLKFHIEIGSVQQY